MIRVTTYRQRRPGTESPGQGGGGLGRDPAAPQGCRPEARPGGYETSPPGPGRPHKAPETWATVPGWCLVRMFPTQSSRPASPPEIGCANTKPDGAAALPVLAQRPTIDAVVEADPMISLIGAQGRLVAS